MTEQKTRIRKQVVIAYRTDVKPYYAEIRVVTFNPDVTERQLMILALKDKRRIEREFGTNLRRVKSEAGTESRPVDSSTDRKLNNKNVYRQVRIKNEIVQFEVVA